MNKEKKYLVIGGKIISKSDGDEHYIGALRLCELYKVNPNECQLIEENNPRSRTVDQTKYEIVLKPRYDGNYTL